MLPVSEVGYVQGIATNLATYLYINPELEACMPSMKLYKKFLLSEVADYIAMAPANNKTISLDLTNANVLPKDFDTRYYHTVNRRTYLTRGYGNVGITDPTYTWIDPWTSTTVSNTSLAIYHHLMENDPARLATIQWLRYGRFVGDAPSRPSPLVDYGDIGIIRNYLFNAEYSLLSYSETSNLIAGLSVAAASDKAAILAAVDATYYKPYVHYGFNDLTVSGNVSIISGTSTVHPTMEVENTATFNAGPAFYSNVISTGLVIHTSPTFAKDVTWGNGSATWNTSVIFSNPVTLSNLTTSNLNFSNGITVTIPSLGVSNVKTPLNSNVDVSAETVVFTSNLLNVAGSVTCAGTYTQTGTMTCGSVVASVGATLSNLNVSAETSILGTLTCPVLKLGGLAICYSNGPAVFAGSITLDMLKRGFVEFPSGTSAGTWTMPSFSSLVVGTMWECTLVNLSAANQTISSGSAEISMMRMTINPTTSLKIIIHKFASNMTRISAPDYLTEIPAVCTSSGNFATVVAGSVDGSATCTTVNASNLSNASTTVTTNLDMNGYKISTPNLVYSNATIPKLISPYGIAVKYTGRTISKYSTATYTILASDITDGGVICIATTNSTWTLPASLTLTSGTYSTAIIGNGMHLTKLTINATAGVLWVGPSIIYADTYLRVRVVPNGDSTTTLYAEF